MQVTIRRVRTEKISDKMQRLAEEEVANRLMSAIDYLEQEVPVRTGAYARSMHLNPRGTTSGSGETSRRKEVSSAPDQERSAMADRLYASLEGLDVLDGATFVNNAPHAKYVEGYYGVFDQLRSILK